MQEEVRAFCSKFRIYGEAKSPNHNYRAPLQSITAGFTDEIKEIDIMGPLQETKRNNKYVLMMVDYFTKWATACSIKNIEATTILQEKFLASLVANHGVSYQFHSIRGS